MSRTRSPCVWPLSRVRRLFFCSSRRRHTRFDCDWSSDVCSSDLSDDIAVETQRDELLGRRLLWSAPAVIRGDNLGSDFDSGTHARPHFISQLECVRIRSEKRRVGKEGRSRVGRDYLKKKRKQDML